MTQSDREARRREKYAALVKEYETKVGAASMPAGSGCCGKPRGCTMTHWGCVYLAHPWKRALILKDPAIRCQATCTRPHPETGELVGWQCTLKNGHAGLCDPRPRPAKGNN